MTKPAVCAWILVLAVCGAHRAVAEGNGPHINYMLNCQGCHLPGGVGHPGIVPNMRGEIGQFLASDRGRAYLVQVPGAAQSSLDNEQLAAVLNWMLLEFDPQGVDPDFERFSAAEVARYRPNQMINVSATRRALLAQPD